MALQLYKIASTEVGSAGASSVEFSSIPQGYTDLKLVISARSTRSGQTDTLFLKFNNTASTYYNRRVYGYASTTGGDTGTTGAGIDIATLNAATSTTGNYSNQEVYIPNYVGSQQKTISYEGVSENNSSSGNFLVMNAGLWNGTSAISTITLTPDVGALVQYSTFTLYGIL